MATEFSTLQSAVLSNLHEDSQFFTSAEIKRALNYAYRDLAKVSKAYRTYEDTTTTSGTYEYDKPDDCIQIREVIFDEKTLRKIDLSEILKNQVKGQAPSSLTGTPAFWAEHELKKIWLYPTPDAAETLRIYYATFPDELTDDTDTIVFEDYDAEQYMIAKATSQLWRKDNESYQTESYKKEANLYLARFICSIKSVPLILESNNEI